jgi:hypothetical protein
VGWPSGNFRWNGGTATRTTCSTWTGQSLEITAGEGLSRNHIPLHNPAVAYYLNLFSPATYEAFSKSDRTVSGFQEKHHAAAKRIKPGDTLLCYVTKLSRWIGALTVVDGPFIDTTPVYGPDDPFIVRFRVNADIWLPMDKAVPIKEDELWSHLSFTKGYERGGAAWAQSVKGSLRTIAEEDARTILSVLQRQAAGGTTYPVDQDAYQRLITHVVRRADKDVTVTVPTAIIEPSIQGEPVTEIRESYRIQALLTDIGARMGLQVWLPKPDRGPVLQEWKGDHTALLERLPLNYDDVTLKTVERIDVLWLKGRSIRRAFEVEHSTSIYSGLLRMADLLALQPNMDIRLHIVAPEERRDKVFAEIRRPVFSLLESGPLAESCTFVSYESIRELAKEANLEYLSDRVLERYEEESEE